MSHDPSEFQFGDSGGTAPGGDQSLASCFRCRNVHPKQDMEFRAVARGHICEDCRANERWVWIGRFFVTLLAVLATGAWIVAKIMLTTGRR